MHLFTRLPISVEDSTLQVVEFKDVEYLVDYEPEAYGHWIFDKGDSSALASLSSEKTLTQQGTATYSDSYLSMSNAAGNALVTDIADIANPVDTYCMVIRNPSFVATRTLFGNAAAETGKGWHVALKLTDGHLQSRSYTSSFFDSGLDTPLNEWVFLAIARNQPGGSRLHYVGGQGSASETALVYTPTVAGVPLRLGNGYYTGNTSALAIDYAELIAFDFALTAEELDVVYARTKARMATRGIDVV